MSRRRAKKRKPLGKSNSDTLLEVLRPFANVVLPGDEEYKGIPSGEDIWVYIGKHERGQEVPHLRLQDFKNIRQLLGE